MKGVGLVVSTVPHHRMAFHRTHRPLHVGVTHDEESAGEPLERLGPGKLPARTERAWLLFSLEGPLPDKGFEALVLGPRLGRARRRLRQDGGGDENENNNCDDASLHFDLLLCAGGCRPFYSRSGRKQAISCDERAETPTCSPIDMSGWKPASHPPVSQVPAHRRIAGINARCISAADVNRSLAFFARHF